MTNGSRDQRPKYAVVVSLLELDDGTSRLIIDDVVSATQHKPTSWAFTFPFTETQFSSARVANLALSEREYQMLGENVVLRLVALNKPSGVADDA